MRRWKDARNEEGDSRSDKLEVADYGGALRWRVAGGSEDGKGDKGKTKKIEMRKGRSGEEGEEGDAGVREAGQGGRGKGRQAGRQGGWQAGPRRQGQSHSLRRLLLLLLSSFVTS